MKQVELNFYFDIFSRVLSVPWNSTYPAKFRLPRADLELAPPFCLANFADLTSFNFCKNTHSKAAKEFFFT